MLDHNVLKDPCPVCGKETILAVIEPHRTHPEMKLHTYRCVDCGPVKTTSVRVRARRLPRAA
jgi:uncharacterized Zn finger protein